jgi:hypothetical protein
MTDLELSKALALAIGWKDVMPNHDRPTDLKDCWVCQRGSHWRAFDYRNWNVIGPIAEKFDAFPYQTHNGTWTVGWTTGPAYVTPQKAIALAVIGARNDYQY